jgi:hypothetical protein
VHRLTARRGKDGSGAAAGRYVGRVTRTQLPSLWTNAADACAVSRAVRARAVEARTAWRDWWARWAELGQSEPDYRVLAVCMGCGRFRDGEGNWLATPEGLAKLLPQSRGLCLTHGFCPPCLEESLRECAGEPTAPVAGAAH